MTYCTSLSQQSKKPCEKQIISHWMLQQHVTAPTDQKRCKYQQITRMTNNHINLLTCRTLSRSNNVRFASAAALSTTPCFRSCIIPKHITVVLKMHDTAAELTSARSSFGLNVVTTARAAGTGGGAAAEADGATNERSSPISSSLERPRPRSSSMLCSLANGTDAHTTEQRASSRSALWAVPSRDAVARRSGCSLLRGQLAAIHLYATITKRSTARKLAWFPSAIASAGAARQRRSCAKN